MSTKNSLSRITIDIPKIDHKKLKAMAAITGKSMRTLVIELIESGLAEYKIEECPYDHTPNKKTIQAIENTKKGKNLKKFKNVDDLFKKLGL